MVHALSQAHKILHTGGLLISVHDLPVPAVIQVHSGSKIEKCGWLSDRNEFISTSSSLYSLAQVVADRMFDLEDERDFDYKVYADSQLEFRQWLSKWWESAIIPDGTSRRLDELVRTSGPGSKIVLAMRARMTKLQAV
jgi:hypothetical protein